MEEITSNSVCTNCLCCVSIYLKANEVLRVVRVGVY